MDEVEPTPLFRVVRGRPDEAELAALTIVLGTRLRAQSDAGWSAYWRSTESRHNSGAHRSAARRRG